MSQLKVDTITDEAGTGSPNFPNGIPGTASDATQNQATWEAGTSTTESIVSPAKVKAAIEALAGLPAPTAGTDYLIMSLQEATVSRTGSYPDPLLHNRAQTNAHLGVTCLVAGTITAYGEHRRDGGSGAAVTRFRILKNGVQVIEWTNNFNTAFTARSVDISVDVGDVIIFQQALPNVPERVTQWRHLRIYSNNPNFAVA